MEKIKRICCGHMNCYILSNGKNAVMANAGAKNTGAKLLMRLNHII